MNIIIIGTSGVGKTTLAKQIAAKLSLKHISLDHLKWLPNWESVDGQTLRARVDEVTKNSDWVIDGNYGSVRDILWPRADVAIWLDYSLAQALWGAFRRISRGSYQAEGCRDSFLRALTVDSIFLWIFKSHWRHKKEYTALFKNNIYPNLRVIRLKKRPNIESLVHDLSAK